MQGEDGVVTSESIGGAANYHFLSDNEIDGYIRDNNGSKAKNPYDKKNFTYYPERDEFRCPMSQTVTFTGELKQFEQEKTGNKEELDKLTGYEQRY